MRRALLRHRLAAGTSRRKSELAPLRPRFQRAGLPFSQRCCRVSTRATRTRRPRTPQRRPLHPIPLVLPRDGSSSRHLGFRRRKVLLVQIKRGTISRSERAKVASETTQTTPARLDCRISATIGDTAPSGAVMPVHFGAIKYDRQAKPRPLASRTSPALPLHKERGRVRPPAEIHSMRRRKKMW
jgi:hypothetical protein